MAALATLSGQPVVACRVSLPRVGAWTADVITDSAVPLGGRVTLQLDGATLQGFVRRGGVKDDAGAYRLVGGAGGLSKLARAQAYNNVQARLVATTVLADAGEALSPLSDAGLLTRFFASWVTLQLPAGSALSTLAVALEAVWRVLPDGTVWLGTETWPTSPVPASVAISSDVRLGTVELATDGALVLPGTVFDGERIEYAEYRLTGQGFSGKAWVSE